MALSVKSAMPYTIYLPKYDPSVKLDVGTLADYEADLDPSRLIIGDGATSIDVNPPTNRQMMMILQKHGVLHQDPMEANAVDPVHYLDAYLDVAKKCVKSVVGYPDLDAVHEDVMIYVGRLITGKAHVDRIDEGNL